MDKNILQWKPRAYKRNIGRPGKRWIARGRARARAAREGVMLECLLNQKSNI